MVCYNMNSVDYRRTWLCKSEDQGKPPRWSRAWSVLGKLGWDLVCGEHARQSSHKHLLSAYHVSGSWRRKQCGGQEKAVIEDVWICEKIWLDQWGGVRNCRKTVQRKTRLGNATGAGLKGLLKGGAFIFAIYENGVPLKVFQAERKLIKEGHKENSFSSWNVIAGRNCKDSFSHHPLKILIPLPSFNREKSYSLERLYNVLKPKYSNLVSILCSFSASQWCVCSIGWLAGH